MKKFLPNFLIICAAVLMIIGISLSVSGVLHNKQVEALAKKEVLQANAGKPSPAPSTIKPTSSTVTSYTVPANQPRYIMIPKLGVQARILAVGLTKTGAIGTPSNVYDTAWYNGSNLPGDSGAMLIDGHVSSWTTHGVFYGIKDLNDGDTIQVERGDGEIFTYKVIKTQIYNANAVNMQSLLKPIVSTRPGLNLITCTGDVIAGTNSFNERVVVYTEQV